MGCDRNSIGKAAPLFFICFSYASRVKLITNDASKNADNKEIARLKSVSISDM